MAGTNHGTTDTSSRSAGTGGIPYAREGEYQVAAEPTGWLGWIVFAGCVMLMVGSFQAIWGLVALFNGDYYVVGPGGLALIFDFTAWGWTHLVLGALVAIIGGAVMLGLRWARYVGMVVAVLSATANFLTLGAYPIWSIIIITVDVFAIYALAVHGGQLASLQE